MPAEIIAGCQNGGAEDSEQLSDSCLRRRSGYWMDSSVYLGVGVRVLRLCIPARVLFPHAEMAEQRREQPFPKCNVGSWMGALHTSDEYR